MRATLCSVADAAFESSQAGWLYRDTVAAFVLTVRKVILREGKGLFQGHTHWWLHKRLSQGLT